MTVHLSCTTCYSLLESTVRVEDLVKKAKQLGYSSVAITDHHVLHGVPPFLHACKKEGIQPILGLEVTVEYHESNVRFVMLAKNNNGYKNLIQMSSILSEGFEALSMDELSQYQQDCFLIAYGEGGWMDGDLLHEDPNAIIEKLQIMKKELPPFDVALSYNEGPAWKSKNLILKKCCQTLKIPTVALNKIFYLDEKGARGYQIVTGIRLQKTRYDKSLPFIEGRFFRSPEQMAAIYEEEDLKRTDEIASQCHADGILEKTSLPKYATPAPLTSSQYLTQLCIAGLKKRLNGNVTKEYENRLKKELNVIVKMHFEDYFLIVYDFIRFARKQGIYVGPGRGSAAGSLTAYCLGITQVDPIKYHLFFERFLNEERISMPDIDTDFPDNRRDEVIQYVYQTYGENHIANIITFGTLGARQVIRDVGRVLNMSVRDTDMICNLIPNTPKMTLKLALQQSSRLKEIVQAEPKYKELFETAYELEGLPRHSSTHAAGIIMSQKPLQDIIPTAQIYEGMKTSQFSAEYLEERGLIKMDFLGLRNLTIIDRIVKEIQKKNPEFAIMQIPLNDSKTYQCLQNADTIGVFQLESEGMKNLLRKMKPTSFNDIVAAIALFRPAAMDNISLYLQNRKNPSKVVYSNPALKQILEDTYGIMVYQEQTMQIAQVAAGFSLGKADILRKAMSKKKEKDLVALREDFMKGCVQNGYSTEETVKMFTLIQRFGSYGFNKSHAVAYGMIAYQLAYLKVNYPLPFYCALLDSVIGDHDKTAQYMDECRRRHLTIGAPSVLKSESAYVSDQGKILVPLTCIKSISAGICQLVVEERQKQSFQDFFDFVARMTLKGVTQKMFESFIMAGALDEFGLTRRTMLYGLEEALSYAHIIQVEVEGQMTINLNLVSKPVLVNRADEKEETGENEKEVLGFYLGSHPMTAIKEKYNIQTVGLAQIKATVGIQEGYGMITNVHPHRTKKGEMMAFVKIGDESGELDLAVMPSLYRQIQPQLVKGAILQFHAKISDDGSGLANQIHFLKKG